jgi:hypothetical protein
VAMALEYKMLIENIFARKVMMLVKIFESNANIIIYFAA